MEGQLRHALMLWLFNQLFTKKVENLLCMMDLSLNGVLNQNDKVEIKLDKKLFYKMIDMKL